MANDSAPSTRVFSLSFGEIRKYRPDHEILPHWSVVMVESTLFSPKNNRDWSLIICICIGSHNKKSIFSIVLHFVGQNGPRLFHFCEGKIYFFFLFFFLGTTGVTFFGRNDIFWQEWFSGVTIWPDIRPTPEVSHPCYRQSIL